MAIVVLCVLALGLSAAAGPAPDAASRHAVGSVPVAAQQAKKPLGVPPLEKTQWVGSPFRLGFDTKETVTKQKVTISLPKLAFMSYLLNCIYSGGAFLAVVGTGRVHDCPGHQDAFTNSPVPQEIPQFSAFADSWVQSATSDAPMAFGTFPLVHVKALAFGTIPVTATARITQTVHHGRIDPLKLAWIATAQSVPPDTPIKGYGKQPPRTPTMTDDYFFADPVKVTGTVDIQISDIAVDGNALPVGASCRAAASEVTLTAPGGYYDTGSPPKKGEPGEFQPLVPNDNPQPLGYLQGNVTITPFTGCRNGAENLDALLTGMISGPNNPVDASMTTSLQAEWCNPDNPDDPSIPDCPPITTTTPPATVAKQAQASAAEIRRTLATLPKATLDLLPRAVREAWLGTADGH
jgi:hypothetical protein